MITISIYIANLHVHGYDQMRFTSSIIRLPDYLAYIILSLQQL
jgi:hypothetical protein